MGFGSGLWNLIPLGVELMGNAVFEGFVEVTLVQA